MEPTDKSVSKLPDFNVEKMEKSLLLITGQEVGWKGRSVQEIKTRINAVIKSIKEGHFIKNLIEGKILEAHLNKKLEKKLQDITVNINVISKNINNVSDPSANRAIQERLKKIQSILDKLLNRNTNVFISPDNSSKLTRLNEEIKKIVENSEKKESIIKNKAKEIDERANAFLSNKQLWSSIFKEISNYKKGSESIIEQMLNLKNIKDIETKTVVTNVFGGIKEFKRLNPTFKSTQLDKVEIAFEKMNEIYTRISTLKS